jgi:MFS family permease
MPRAPYPKRWLAMLIVSISVSMIIMDATVVNVVLPVLIRDLTLSAADAEWVNSVYALVFAACLITAGRLGDMHGRRRLLLVGTVVFGAASVLAALAGNGGILIMARLLQGLGGAMILPATLSTVNAMFTGRERGIAFAIWGSTIGGMAAVGPLAGGWLTTTLSWHWAFLINIPVVLIMFIGTLAVVPETRGEGTRRGLDPLGIILSIAGLGGIVYGLIEGQRFGRWEPSAMAPHGWPLSPVPVAFAIGIACLVAFVLLERARRAAGKVVLVDLSLFSLRSFRIGSLAALVVALGEFGMLFALPLFLQGVLGYTRAGNGRLGRLPCDRHIPDFRGHAAARTPSRRPSRGAARSCSDDELLRSPRQHRGTFSLRQDLSSGSGQRVHRRCDSRTHHSERNSRRGRRCRSSCLGGCCTADHVRGRGGPLPGPGCNPPTSGAQDVPRGFGWRPGCLRCQVMAPARCEPPQVSRDLP